MEDARVALRACPLLDGIPLGQLDRLAAQATRRAFHRRQVIFASGDSADCVYLLISGNVRIYHLLPDGHELTVGLISSGELFGIVGLIGPGTRPRFAQALTAVVCLCLPVEAILELFRVHAEFALRLTSYLGSMIGRSENLATSLAFLGVRGRLALALLRLHEQGVAGGQAALRLTHADLATMIGTTREHVTRLLADFEHAGYIGKRNGHVIAVRCPDGLRAEIQPLQATP